MAEQIISQDYLKQIFDYKDGELYWKKTKRSHLIGKIAGGIDSTTQYFNVKIGNKKYKNHRLIFLMHHGYLPKVIDHIDRNPSNNCIENLRESTVSQNLHNRTAQKNSKSGIKGVYWLANRKKWVARCKIGKTISKCSYFDTMEQAKEAIEKFRHEHLGEFTTH